MEEIKGKIESIVDEINHDTGGYYSQSIKEQKRQILDLVDILQSQNKQLLETVESNKIKREAFKQLQTELGEQDYEIQKLKSTVESLKFKPIEKIVDYESGYYLFVNGKHLPFVGMYRDGIISINLEEIPLNSATHFKPMEKVGE